MATTIQDSVHLAVVGLGLVLLSCMLLVGLIRILVALTGHTPAAAPQPPDAHRRDAAHATRARAAAVGVAAALALAEHGTRTVPPVSVRPQTSPWQEVMRAAQLRTRSRRQ